jgi:phage tail-like protein
MNKLFTLTVNPHRFDPYKNFNFRVRWDGRVVAGLQKCSGLKWSTDPVRFSYGAKVQSADFYKKQPGLFTYQPVSLESGVTQDTDFEDWANLVSNPLNDEAISLKHFRKEVTIEFNNEAANEVVAYTLHNCWVAEYQALPDLDANGHAVAIASLKLEYDGWTREQTPTEPKET